MIFWAEESLDCYLRMKKPLLNMVDFEEQQRALSQANVWDNATIRTLHAYGLFREPFVAMVGSKEQRHLNKHFVSVLMSSRLPDNALVRLSENVYILSPPLCVVALARNNKIGDIELLFDISELCSCYAYENIPSLNRQIIERKPFLSVSGIRKFFAEMKRINNVAPRKLARAEKLLPYVIERARSPREIEVGINLGAPVAKGGIGVPAFEVNKQIQLTEQEQWMLDKHHLEADFVWERQKLIVEYDGGVHDASRVADSMRVNVLRGKGYSVEVLTRGILDAGIGFETFVSRLEGPLGIRVARDADARMQRQLLQRETARLARRNGHAIPPEKNGVL